jgi:hypothetical protein
MDLSYLRIVVIALVLGVFAKMAGPQSGTAAVGDNTTRLIEMLVQIRTGLNVYRAEHDGQLPSTQSCEEFQDELTQRNGQFGPYIGDIPRNPFNGLDEVRFDGAPAGANKAGWRLDTKTGAFQADNGIGYSAL